ncbi:MAG: hypothetical protein ACTMIK_08920, partial [Galactobacter sp.]
QQVIVTAAVREDVPPELDATLVPVGPGWIGQEPTALEDADLDAGAVGEVEPEADLADAGGAAGAGASETGRVGGEGDDV